MAHVPYPHLWFNGNAEEAMNYYCEVFPNSHIVSIDRYPDESLNEHFKGMSGKVIAGVFELNGARFACLDGNEPDEEKFGFNNSVSLVVECDNQEEIDHYWEKLSAKPDEEQCGWCTDRFGVRWQVIPSNQSELLANPEQIQAMMQMKKFDLKTLEDLA